MAFKIFTALSLCAATLAAPLHLQSRLDRGNILVIGARGSYQPPGLGSLQGIADNIQKYSPGAKASAVNYPAVIQEGYGGSVAQGVTDLQSQITQAVAADPNVKIALLGYSQGANVVMDALCGSSMGSGIPALGGQYTDNIKSVIIFGDPSHFNQQTFVRGSQNTNGMIPRADPNTYMCPPFTSKIISYCNDGDPVCASGNDGNAHTTYFDLFGTAASWLSLAKLWYD